MNDLVKKYLQDKYGENYDQKAQGDYEGAQSTNRWAQLGSNIGDAIAGNKIGSANGYFQDLNKQAKENTIGKIENDRNSYVKNQLESGQMADLQDKDRIRSIENDPANPQALAFRNELAKFGVKIPDGMNIADMKRNYGDAKSFKEIQMRSQIDFNNQKSLRGMDQGFREKESELDRNLKRELEEKQLGQKNIEKAEKQKLGLTEVNDRYTNMKDSIKSLKSLIEKTSGGDFTGPENKQMDQYITSIATDMAKLVDPQSVARESEVASFKQMLFEPGVLNTMFTRVSTLQSVVDNFENMVDKRLDTAYKVRGLEKSDQMKQASTPDPKKQSDDAALNWSMANPKDPRSEAILKKLNPTMKAGF